MSVSGLVVSVADEDIADGVALVIGDAGPFTLGERVGPRLAVALVAEDGPAAGRWHEWLRQLPGVVKVDVAFVYSGTMVEEPTCAR
jgi:hypothetical protein